MSWLKCSDMGASEFLINEMMLTVKPHSEEVQLTCFKPKYVDLSAKLNQPSRLPTNKTLNDFVLIRRTSKHITGHIHSILGIQ